MSWSENIISSGTFVFIIVSYTHTHMCLYQHDGVCECVHVYCHTRRKGLCFPLPVMPFPELWLKCWSKPPVSLQVQVRHGSLSWILPQWFRHSLWKQEHKEKNGAHVGVLASGESSSYTINMSQRLIFLCSMFVLISLICLRSSLRNTC